MTRKKRDHRRRHLMKRAIMESFRDPTGPSLFTKILRIREGPVDPKDWAPGLGKKKGSK